MALATSRTPDQDSGVTSFFDAPFTAISNQLLESIYTDPNASPSTRLLLFIARFSTGYLRPEVVLIESFILETTKMSRSSFYKAKKELIDTGKITVSHTQTGNCVYRLVSELQCLRGASAPRTAAERAEQRWAGSAVGDPPRPQLETPYKETQENLDQHHSLPPVTPPNDDDSSLIPSASKGNAMRHALADHLKSFGVSEFMAYKLTKSHNEEVISLALSRLKSIAPENPAAYLVAEIMRGGYGQPAPDKTKIARLEQEKIHQKRRQERQQEAQAKDQSSERVAGLLAQFENLPPDRQRVLQAQLDHQAQQEGFTRLTGWGDSHPLYRGLLAEILSHHLTQGQGQPLCLRE